MSKIEIYQARPSQDGDWRWRLVASNRKIVAQGEGYLRRAGAIRGAQAMQRAAALAVLKLL